MIRVVYKAYVTLRCPGCKEVAITSLQEFTEDPGYYPRLHGAPMEVIELLLQRVEEEADD